MTLIYTPTLCLYRQMMKEASRFHSFIFRRYALRRIKDAFQEQRSLTDPRKIEQALSFVRPNLEILRRQTVLDNMYKANRVVIEPPPRSPQKSSLT